MPQSFVLNGMLKKQYRTVSVAEYQLVRVLPEPLDTCLPSIEEIEAVLGGEWND